MALPNGNVVPASSQPHSKLWKEKINLWWVAGPLCHDISFFLLNIVTVFAIPIPLFSLIIPPQAKTAGVCTEART